MSLCDGVKGLTIFLVDGAFLPGAWSIVCASHMGIEYREGEGSNDTAQDILVLHGKQALNEEDRKSVV